LTAKYSLSAHQPFKRMLVKIKKEIIAFGVDGIDPVNKPAPRLAPAELKAWLDEGRDVVLLDTRNDYEVKLGTFHNAKVIGVDHFRQFPTAVAALPAEMKDQVIVSFCTGGIRCEKAAPFLIDQGFQNVYQLDGGILKYFEDCGNAHYDGDCFVFDQRVGLDPALAPAECARCVACQAPVIESHDGAAIDDKAPRCRNCQLQASSDIANVLQQRQAKQRDVTTPLLAPARTTTIALSRSRLNTTSSHCAPCSPPCLRTCRPTTGTTRLQPAASCAPICSR
jgi:predicted sulfurtransferase